MTLRHILLKKFLNQEVFNMLVLNHREKVRAKTLSIKVKLTRIYILDVLNMMLFFSQMFHILYQNNKIHIILLIIYSLKLLGFTLICDVL